MNGREAEHIIPLPGVPENGISFLSQIKVICHAGMNNFMAIDIHILTNRRTTYGHVGEGGSMALFQQKGERGKKRECHSNNIWNMFKL